MAKTHFTLRDELLARFERETQYYVEEYAKRNLNLIRQEMFDKVKTNELVWGLGLADNIWYIFTHEHCRRCVEDNIVREDYLFPSKKRKFKDHGTSSS